MADYYDQVLDLLKQGESGGKNIKNYRFDPTHTAQGYWQITNQNWNAFAPKVGIDTSKYPNAMSMEEADQRKVARHILTNTPGGIGNWEVAKTPEFRDKLKGLTMPQDQSYDNMSLEDLQKLSQQLHGQLDNLKGTTKPAPKNGKVEPPQSWLERAGRWAEDVQGSGYGVIPAIRTGSKVFSDPDWRDKTSDVIEGSGELGPLATASSLVAAPFTGGGSELLRQAAKLGLGWAGSKGASWLADQMDSDADPKTQRLIHDLAGLGGATIGYKGPEIAKNPKVQAGALVAGGAAVGHPWIGTELAALRLGLPTRLRGGRSLLNLFGKDEGPMPTDKVASPGKPLPKTTVEDDMLRTGSITPEQHTQRMMDMGMDEGAAKAKTTHAQKTHIEEALKEANKNKPAQQQPQVTLKPRPIDQTPTATPTGGTPPQQSLVTPSGAEVTLPPQVQAQGPAPQGTPTPPPLNLPVNPPVPQQPLASTFDPRATQVAAPRPPLQGPAATQTPIAPPLGQQPQTPVPGPNLGTVKFGNQPSVAPQPIVPKLPATEPTGTSGITIRPPAEVSAKDVFDAAEAAGHKLKKNSTYITRQGVAKKLGLKGVPSREAYNKAVALQGSKEPAPENP